MRAKYHIVTATVAGLSLLTGGALAHYGPLLLPQASIETSARFLERFTQFDVVESTAMNVMIGDSLTERGLWEDLFDGHRVANRGLGSITSQHLIDSPPRLPVTMRRAFLMIGVNDAAKSVPEQVTLSNVQKYIVSLHETGADVVVTSTLLTSNRRWNTRIEKINRAMEAYCHTGQCTFVDLNSGLAPNGVLKQDITIDGVHLTGAGYRYWADSLMDMLLDNTDHSSPAG